MNSRIQAIHARQIIDCKCRPMVEVDVITEGGFSGTGCAPTGSSVGMYESFVLRDHNPKEYHGMSIHKAVENVNRRLAPALIGMDVLDLPAIDRRMIELDGTENKKNLGGNAIYSVSIAAFRAAAACCRQPLYSYIAQKEIETVPIPSFNIINGGRYSDLVQPFNEFLILPYKARDIYEAVEMGVNTFQELKSVLTRFLGGKSPETAPSYGYAAPSEDPEIVLELMQEAVARCGYSEKMAFALDCASSEMYNPVSGTYLLKGEQVSSGQLIRYVKNLTEKFPFVFIEDLLDENDWDGWQKAHQEITDALLLGDDLIATNPKRLQKACSLAAIDGFILKPNQVGTITEALKAYDFARKNHLLATPSGRSGGVVGDVVMDLAVGLSVPFIKNGPPRSGERIAKLNFLMRVCDASPGCRLSDISPLLRF